MYPPRLVTLFALTLASACSQRATSATMSPSANATAGADALAPVPASAERLPLAVCNGWSGCVAIDRARGAVLGASPAICTERLRHQREINVVDVYAADGTHGAFASLPANCNATPVFRWPPTVQCGPDAVIERCEGARIQIVPPGTPP